MECFTSIALLARLCFLKFYFFRKCNRFRYYAFSIECFFRLSVPVIFVNRSFIEQEKGFAVAIKAGAGKSLLPTFAGKVFQF